MVALFLADTNIKTLFRLRNLEGGAVVQYTFLNVFTEVISWSVRVMYTMNSRSSLSYN